MLLGFICGIKAFPITMYYDKTEPSLKLSEEIIEHQICKGFFEPIGNKDFTYEISITSEDKKMYYLYQEKLKHGEETHFSFNNIDPQKLYVEAKPVSLVNNLGLKDMIGDFKLKYNFEYQFDTFNKDVAKDVRIQPTVQALMHLERLMHEVFLQTEARGDRLRVLSMQHNRIMNFVVGFSVFTLMLVIVTNLYQTYSMKRFFKKKKII